MENIKVGEFLNEIEGTYNKYFTDSKCIAKLNTSLYNSISVKCLLANNKSECINGYFENDMFSISFLIDVDGKELDKSISLDSVLPKNLQIQVLDNSYLIKPNDKYLCYSRRKLSYRKTKGDGEKLLKTFDKWFKKLSDELKNDINNSNIHDNHINLLTSKLI